MTTRHWASSVSSASAPGVPLTHGRAMHRTGHDLVLRTTC